MQINGPTHVHPAQGINAPHHNARASQSAAAQGSSLAQVDQLDISPEASFAAQAQDLPDVRQSRVAEIRAQIESGAYETDDKLEGALERLLDEIG
jgi:flagellar biosynthesis anti-sigma factor FlgM